MLGDGRSARSVTAGTAEDVRGVSSEVGEGVRVGVAMVGFGGDRSWLVGC